MKPPDRIICESALRLATRQDWSKTTLDQIAKTAKISPASFKNRFHDKREILPLIVEWTTEKTLARCDKPAKSDTLHDRLFDLLMARFDVLNEHRKAILSIAAATRTDPQSFAILLRAQKKAMQVLHNFCSPPKSKTYGIFTSCILWTVFAVTYIVWEKDQTLDMSKTMAALDRYLRYACSAATLLRADSWQQKSP